MSIPLIIRPRLVNPSLEFQIRQREMNPEAGAFGDAGAAFEEPDASLLVAEGVVEEGLVGGDGVCGVEEDAPGGGGRVVAWGGDVRPGVGEGGADGGAFFGDGGGRGGGEVWRIAAD